MNIVNVHIKILKITALVLLVPVVLFITLSSIFPLPDKIEYSTIITDNKDEVIHAFLTSDDKWRMKTELEEISPLLRKTIIRKEDRYFYHHPGVNPIAVVRAFVQNTLNVKRTSGASTITMQVARALEPKKRTYFNKLIEVFRAFQLELKYSKNEILQLYLNLVPYGGNIEGVKSASILYFKKNPDHLSLAEITALSIIPNRPSSLVMGKHNHRIVEERNQWLKRFAQEKVFSQKEIVDALSEPLTATRETVPKLIPHLAYKLKKSGRTYIQTHIDINTQLKIEKLVLDQVKMLSLKNIRNAAVIVLDNRSHKVISYIGSANFYDTIDAGQVNGAEATRQPGSTLKPLLYAMCIDEGLMTPKAMITDIGVNYDGYAPENFDKKFNGNVTMEFALDHSLNIPAVRGLKMLGKDNLIQKLAACEFSQVRKDQKKLGLSMILGGCGSSLEELTALYSSFANEGIFYAPTYLKHDTVLRKRIVVSPAASFMINEILSKVNRPDFPLNWQSTERMPKIAWKTGTSYGRRDAWSIGYNKHFTVGVWVGNFSAASIPELSGTESATPLLFKIFNTIDYDSDEGWFSPSPDLDFRIVCSESGMLPGEHCKDLVTDEFIPLTSSAKRCTHLQEVIVSIDERISFCKTCMPANGYKKMLYKSVSAELQAYFAENRISYDRIPQHNPDCENVFKEGSPAITSPRNGSEYLISKKSIDPLQLSCNVANDVTRVFWHINNQFYKSGDAKTKLFFIPEEGPIKISCTDDKGRNKDIWIRVRFVNF